jgi:hypothetical protein
VDTLSGEYIIALFPFIGFIGAGGWYMRGWRAIMGVQ